MYSFLYQQEASVESRKQDCNWIVKQAALAKQKLSNMLLLSVSDDVSARTLVRIQVNKMSLNDVNDEIRSIKYQFTSDLKKCSKLIEGL